MFINFAGGQQFSVAPKKPAPPQIDVTTMAMGEEGGTIPPPSTMAMGEEGGGATTMAMSEEGGTIPPPSTMAMGEEGGGATTLAMGEEGGTLPPPSTMAMGEEGGGQTFMTQDVTQVMREADNARGRGNGQLTRQELSAYKASLQLQMNQYKNSVDPGIDPRYTQLGQKLKIATLMEQKFSNFAVADSTAKGGNSQTISATDINTIAGVDGNPQDISPLDFQRRIR